MQKQLYEKGSGSQAFYVSAEQASEGASIYTSVRFRREFEFTGVYPMALSITGDKMREQLDELAQYGVFFTPEALDQIQKEININGKAEII